VCLLLQKLAVQMQKTAQQVIHVRAPEASWQKSRHALMIKPPRASTMLDFTSGSAGAGVEMFGDLSLPSVAASGEVCRAGRASLRHLAISDSFRVMNSWRCAGRKSSHWTRLSKGSVHELSDTRALKSTGEGSGMRVAPLAPWQHEHTCACACQERSHS